jgi:hypothetical protein
MATTKWASLIVDVDEVDFVDNPEHLEVFNRIDAELEVYLNRLKLLKRFPKHFNGVLMSTLHRNYFNHTCLLHKYTGRKLYNSKIYRDLPIAFNHRVLQEVGDTREICSTNVLSF